MIPAGLCQCGCGRETKLRPDGSPRRYVRGHNGRCAHPDYKLEDRGYTTLCWIWLKMLNESGYGVKGVAHRPRKAHRVYYERLVGPIAPGCHLHHLCEVPACVNPAHMEVVTPVEHALRHASEKTHCVHGHAFDEANTYIRRDTGARYCRACGRDRAARRKAAARAQAMGEAAA